MYFIPIFIAFFIYDSNLFRNALRNRFYNSNLVIRDKILRYCRDNIGLTRELLVVNSNIIEKQTYQKLRLSSDIDYSVEKKTTGHAHSDESKAKISAANKGKVPWNLGRQHSEETKRRIAEKTKESYMKKKLAEASQLGISIEEMEKSKKEVKNQKKIAALKGGLTEEGRKRIAESVKKRWEDPSYKDWYSKKMRGSRNHSEATREKISEAIKKKWTDAEYRSIERKPPNEEVRARISAALKSKWEQPQYRERMRNSSYTRTDAWRAVISQKVKEKWKDPVYKEAVASALRKHFDLLRSNSTSTSAAAKRRRRSSSSAQEMMLRRREIAAMQKAKKMSIKAAKDAVRNRTENLDLKSLLGKDIWFEEKIKRKQDGGAFMDDDELTKQLYLEWSVEDSDDEEEEDLMSDDADILDNDVGGSDSDLLSPVRAKRKKSSPSRKSSPSTSRTKSGSLSAPLSSEGDDDDEYDTTIDGETEDDFGLAFDDDLEVSTNAEDDLIEVYDEDGELVGVYDLQEFQKIKSSSSGQAS